MIATMLPVALRGERGGGDERGLAGDERQAARFEEDDAEDDPEPVVLDEVRQVRRLSRTDWPHADIGSEPMRVGIPCETTEASAASRLFRRPSASSWRRASRSWSSRARERPLRSPTPPTAEAGATLGDPWAADGVVKVRKPSADEREAPLGTGLLIGFLEPLSDPAGVEALAARGVTAFALESVPRITRAQSMDALSSQATVGGYKAALLAAEHLPRFFPMLMTAAGTVPPAKVLVIGAGVAGLQAIATVRRLGAVTTGFDVRPVVREQIESLGANWLDLGVTGAEAEGGYARELTPEEMKAQQEALEDGSPTSTS